MIPIVGSLASGLGSAIGTVATLGSSIFSSERSARSQEKTNEMNLQIARETNQANRDLYREQYANSVEQWLREAKYNSPQNKVAQLRAAGLNPSLAYGQSQNVGSAQLPDAAPAVTGAPMSPPYGAHYSDVLRNGFSSAINDFMSLLEGQQRVRSMSVDNQLKEATLSDKITESMLSLNKMRQSLRYDKRLYKLVGEQIDDLVNRNRLFKDTYNSQVDASVLNNDVMRSTIDEARSTMAVHRAQIDSMNLASKLSIERNQREWQALQGSLAQIYATVDNLRIEGRLTEQNIKNAVETGLSLKLSNGKSAQDLIHNKDLFPLVLEQTKSNIRHTNIKTVSDFSNTLSKPLNSALSGLLMLGKGK